MIVNTCVYGRHYIQGRPVTNRNTLSWRRLIRWGSTKKVVDEKLDKTTVDRNKYSKIKNHDKSKPRHVNDRNVKPR